MKKTLLLILIIISAMAAAIFIITKSELLMKTSTMEAPRASAPPVLPPQRQPEDLTGKQIIVFAFDGSKSLDMWQKSLDFSSEMTAQNKPIHFTYFISGVYLLTYQNRFLYHPPEAAAGTSTIGYADSNDDLTKRINFINQAVKEGHEIGSHLNGHFDGTKWSQADWEQEFSEFNKLVSNVNGNNNIPNDQVKMAIDSQNIVGFRAPDLGRNQFLWLVLKNHGFIYDTSTVGRLGEWPKKEDGLWKFAIPQIKFASTNYHLLSMDYNFYVKQTHAKDLLKAGTPAWQKASDEMYSSYINYFQNNYTTTKAPIFIAHHFSEWNDGVYWETLKKFANEKCGQPDVRCITYKELTDYLNNRNP